MSAEISIIVLRGVPVDLQRTRHTALLTTFSDGSTVLVHATGGAGFFAVETKSGVRPKESQRFVEEICVGKITGPTKTQVQTILVTTPVNNILREWNCQNWVGEALTRLVAQRWISNQQRDTAFSRMIDVTMDAEDEED